MRDGDAGPGLAELCRRFAVGAGRDGAHRYERICLGVAQDPALLGLIAAAPADQRRPNILLAAVHDLLLSGLDDPLADFYPTVQLWRTGSPTARTGDPYPAFAELCRDRRSAIADLVATRATQTNEVGRCAALLPAFNTVAERAGAPLALVDVGAAAGLNLWFDRYAYVYGRAGGAGRFDSPVVLHCDVRSGRPPLAMPPVAARVGIDRRPIDPQDRDSSRWLLACMWPDHPQRFATVRAALDLAGSTGNPPPVRRGDAIENLATVVDVLPAGVHVCVFHSWVAAYLTPDDQLKLSRTITELAARRPLSWLFAESPYEVPALAVPRVPGAGGATKDATAVVLVEHAADGEPQATRLADMHPHGRWLAWYGHAGSPPPVRGR